MFNSFRRVPTRLCARNLVTKPSEYGQPTLLSHPHLIRGNDLTPGIPASEYEERRRKLMDLLPEKSVVISVAASVKFMSANIFYKYRQASDFWYLTGFEEPDSAVILEKDSSSKGYKMTLFASGKDLAKEKWDGATTSLAAAKEIFHADETYSINTFSSQVKSLLPHASNVYVDLPALSTKSTRKKPKSFLKYLAGPSSSDSDDLLDSISSSIRRPLAAQMGKLRAIKSKAEQAVMRSAADISGRAHAKTMRFTRPGQSEAAVAAHFEYLCSLSGSQRLAYVPVVASGANALILHYTCNNHIIEQDELILMDAGCEYNGYASDITRTYPASGTFSPAQRDLYSAVLSAQKELIKLCSAEAVYSLQELHRKSCQLLKEELNQIGFNLGKEGDLERILYPHYLSHPIGVDLHESSHIDRSAPLQDGMVITIEPGIYVPPTANFPKHYHNIGIRIEDEVLVGEKDPIVLSVSAPKEIEDVEGACQGILGLEPY
ncbi:peptidase M24 [Pholiota conissans]|uniref:Peptidase M24 n=1 Tax=Pholiota conissans TaxID=109636 RepID=A0A9P5Z5Y9_9AGAR|nr:peptidase M24 [Pholiota conissans]